MAIIAKIEKNSEAKRLGLKIGDEIVSINGRPFLDVIDYVYYDAQEVLSIKINRRGKEKTFKLIKEENEPLGIVFEDELELKPSHCQNKCIFCFIDQLPKGMRDTLYVKDDDYRMSVICGNYVTLSNLNEEDFERIITMKLSPIYISVHSTDGDIRKKMMANPRSADIMKNIKRLTDAGITIHTQVVLCEGVNDGAVLEKTITDLYSFYPKVASLAVVPVGLTGFREDLYPLKPLSAECMKQTVNTVEKFNSGKNWCWCSDEFYVKIGLPVPSYESYGDFCQIENGVGLVADFIQNFDKSIEDIEGEIINGQGRKIAFITGESFGEILQKTVNKLKKYTKNLILDVFVVKNLFFGGAITVSGLVVGGDIIKQVPKGYDKYVLPHNMLREFQKVFLDDITLDDLKRELGGKSIEIAYGNGGDLVEIIKR